MASQSVRGGRMDLAVLLVVGMGGGLRGPGAAPVRRPFDPRFVPSRVMAAEPATASRRN